MKGTVTAGMVGATDLASAGVRVSSVRAHGRKATGVLVFF